jgi:hypothetical protein
VNNEDLLRKVISKMTYNKTDKEDSPGERVLQQIEYRLRITRDKVERSILKGILLRVGISEISNKTNRTFAIKDKT